MRGHWIGKCFDFFLFLSTDVGPLRILLLYALLGLVMVVLNAWHAMQTPWLGLTFSQDTNGVGLRVTSVASGSPAQNVLFSGSIIAAFSGASGLTVHADQFWTLAYSCQSSNYADFNRFVSSQRELYTALTQPKLIALLRDGSYVNLDKATQRPLKNLSLGFWLITLIGYMGFLISGSVWIFHRQDMTARLFALSGVGFLFMALGLAAFSARELAVNLKVLPWLLWMERIGDLVFAYSLCALLWYYPSQLLRAPVVTVMLLLIVLLGVNDALQLYQFPFHAFMLPDFLIPLVFCIIVSALQWRKSKYDPIERAILQWPLLSLLVSASVVMILCYILPTFNIPFVAPLWLDVAIIFLLYPSIAFGILKYRLFDLERFKLGIISWIVSGFLIFWMDALLIMALDIHAGLTIWLSIAIVSWGYFPLRQCLSKLLSNHGEQRIETYLSQFNTFLANTSSGRDVNLYWFYLLRQIFEPMDSKPAPESLAFPEIRDNGLVLAVPGLKNSESVMLIACNAGQRLFTRNDQNLVVALHELAGQNLRQQQMRMESILSERERILRDLHDDVAAPLMMLGHRAEKVEYQKLATSALLALREAVHGLQQTESIPLVNALADWRAEAHERLEAAGVTLCWEESSSLNTMLTPHEHLNLGRVLREAISNALNHAAPKTVKISINYQEKFLMFCIIDDGVGGDPKQWAKQTGINSMQKRMKEMNGKVSWFSSVTEGTRVEMLTPLHNFDASSISNTT